VKLVIGSQIRAPARSPYPRLDDSETRQFLKWGDHVGMKVRRVVPDFHAQDPAAGGEFYAEVLGLEVVMDQGWIVTYAAPGNPAAQISVMRQDASAPVQADVSIEVDDVDAAHAAAQRLGCEILHPLTDEPWGVRRFFVRDPTGKVLNILSHP
jgi:predicted enzyme related to lactoylglutathione lyase